MLVSPPPPQTAPGTTLASAFVVMLEALAKNNGCGYVDYYGRQGGTWQTAFMSDFTHPNDYGTLDWAQQIATNLTSF